MSCARGPTGMILVSLCAYGVLLSLLSTSSSESQVICKQCKAGTFANHSLPSCSLCDPGSCEVEEGKSYCTPCPQGQNQSSASSGSCENCPSGTFANVTGLKLCYLCPEGMHYNKTGAEMCLPCQPGRNVSRAGSVNCQLCPTGSICNATGCSTCQTCKAGFAPSVGSTYCANCPEGTYSKIGVTCEPCPHGTYCPNGSSQPIWCHRLFSYSYKKEKCVAQPVLYVMVVCLTVFVLLVIALVCFAIYWKMCRKKRMQDMLPLVPKKKSNKTGSQDNTGTYMSIPSIETGNSPYNPNVNP